MIIDFSGYLCVNFIFHEAALTFKFLLFLLFSQGEAVKPFGGISEHLKLLRRPILLLFRQGGNNSLALT